MERIRGRVSAGAVIGARLSGSGGIGARIDNGKGRGYPYDGPYEVTPTRYTQVLYTNGKTLADDVTVKPIPPEYGLITYNGSVITVS